MNLIKRKIWSYPCPQGKSFEISVLSFTRIFFFLLFHVASKLPFSSQEVTPFQWNVVHHFIKTKSFWKSHAILSIDSCLFVSRYPELLWLVLWWTQRPIYPKTCCLRRDIWELWTINVRHSSNIISSSWQKSKFYYVSQKINIPP